MTPVLFAVEGASDVAVAEKLILHVGRVPRVVAATGGSSVIDDRLLRWAQPTNQTPMLVLRDWDDRDGVPCPSALVEKIASTRPANVAVRIVVRSIEAWLMADSSAARAFFRSKAIPSQPELEPRPKIALVQACRASKLRRIRDGIVPPPRSGAVVGPEYSLLINEYARDHWDVSRALQNAPSLARAVQRLETLVATQVW
jgi:hypothetical protein